MEKEVKVSVIVPVYNSEAFIRQTAEYILGQSLKDIEIIFVDDGSTDKTREILEEISKTDDRVKVLHQQNSFAGAARNYGFRESSGKYLVFWDADDIFLPEALEKMYDKIVEDDADICICPADYYDNETSKILKNNRNIASDNGIPITYMIRNIKNIIDATHKEWTQKDLFTRMGFFLLLLFRFQNIICIISDIKLVCVCYKFAEFFYG